MKSTNSYSILIDDDIDNVLSFDLRDLLSHIHLGGTYEWTVTDLEAVGIDMNGLELTKSEFEHLEHLMDLTQYSVTWSDLCAFAALPIQIINGVFLGVSADRFIKITSFDSRYWIVESSEISLIKSISTYFKQTKLL